MGEPFIVQNCRKLTQVAPCLECKRLAASPFASGFSMSSRWLTALPVYNEARHVNHVLDEVRRYCDEVLVVDDGSTDGTSELLRKRKDIQLASHDENRGYGSALMTAFAYAQRHGYDKLVTIDC